MVRYHSLVIEPESLPKELIPIAWTPTAETTPFLGISQSNSFGDACEGVNGKKVYVEHLSKRDGKSSFSHDAEDIQAGQIIMGIKHSSRPHYGLQVCSLLLSLCLCVKFPVLSLVV